MKNILIFILLLLSAVCVSAQNVTYTYDNAGNRTARTVSGTLKSSQAVEAQQTVTALPNLITEKDITVYPNPTQGHFTVDISNVHHDNLKGEAILFDMNGRLIEKKSIHSHSGQKRMEFHINHKSPGTYLLRLHIEENTFTWKIIKK